MLAATRGAFGRHAIDDLAGAIVHVRHNALVDRVAIDAYAQAARRSASFMLFR
jgi:hypothetical protein